VLQLTVCQQLIEKLEVSISIPNWYLLIKL